MTVKANDTHDISFVEPTGSTEIGLMLVPGKDKAPLWKEYDDPALAQQFFSGAPGYANLPPEKEVQIAQSSWQAGVGQEVFDSSDDKRYWFSNKMDLRFKGRAMLGPAVSAKTIPAGVVKASYNFNDDLYIGVLKSGGDGALCRLNGIGTKFGEVYSFSSKGVTDLEEYTDGNGYIALGGTNKYYYMTSELVVENCEDAWDELTEADVTPSADGTTFNYMNGSASAKFIIGGDLNAGELIATEVVALNLTSYTDITFWIKSSVALTANDLQLLLSANPECASPTEELNIPAVAMNTWTSVHISFADPTDLGAIISIGLKMVVDKGAFNLWIDDVRAGAYTESSKADGKADFLQTVGVTLWKAVKPRTLMSSTDPEGTGWSGTTTVGSTAQDITGLLEESAALYIMKEDMPYYIDTDGNVQRLIPELKTLESSTSGVNSLVWKAKIYIPCGEQGLVEYDDGTVTWRSPSLYITNYPALCGRIHALAADEQYLYALVKDTTGNVIHLLAGREEEIDGTDRWVWHPLNWVLSTGCSYSFISSVYKRRIYVAYSASEATIATFPIPTNYSDPDSDSDYVFETYQTSYFETPWLHANFKGDDKAYIKLTLTLEDTSDSEYIEAWYMLKGQSVYTEIGDYTTEPTQTRYIPANSSGDSPEGTMIRFKFVAETSDTSTTPKLLGYDCRAIWYPTKRWLIGCSVKCADNIVIKDKTVDTQTAAQITTAITDAVEHNWPITLYPPEYASSADTLTVKILRAEKVMTKNMLGQNPEYQYNLLLAKTPLA